MHNVRVDVVVLIVSMCGLRVLPKCASTARASLVVRMRCGRNMTGVEKLSTEQLAARFVSTTHAAVAVAVAVAAAELRRDVPPRAPLCASWRPG